MQIYVTLRTIRTLFDIRQCEINDKRFKVIIAARIKLQYAKRPLSSGIQRSKGRISREVRVSGDAINVTVGTLAHRIKKAAPSTLLVFSFFSPRELVLIDSSQLPKNQVAQHREWQPACTRCL